MSTPIVKMLKDGAICDYEVPTDVLTLCNGMSGTLEAYFLLDEQTQLLDIDALVLSRARPEGLLGAARKMREAALELRNKRKPVTVRKHRDLYVVEDGNSTTIILAAIGIRTVPVTLA